MRQPAVRPAFAIGALWLALLPGCRATRPCSSPPADCPRPQAACPQITPSAAAPSPPALAESPPAEPSPEGPSEEVARDCPFPLPPTQESQPQALPIPATDQVVPSSHDRVVNEVREQLERLRCGAEVTGDSTRGHAPDYSWLVGELNYVHVRGVWRLRYALPGEDDRYGGTVTLTGMLLPPALHNGQLVRVEGSLRDSDSGEPSPAYELHKITPLPAAP